MFRFPKLYNDLIVLEQNFTPNTGLKTYQKILKLLVIRTVSTLNYTDRVTAITGVIENIRLYETLNVHANLYCYKLLNIAKFVLVFFQPFQIYFVFSSTAVSGRCALQDATPRLSDFIYVHIPKCIKLRRYTTSCLIDCLPPY